VVVLFVFINSIVVVKFREQLLSDMLKMKTTITQ